MISIVVADDHPSIRKGFIQIIENYSDLSVIGEASNGEEAIEIYNKMKPDVFILDIRMPKINGLDAAKKILNEIDPNAIILFCSIVASKSEIYKAYQIGCSGFIHKDREPGTIIEAIRLVSEGEVYFDDVFTFDDFNQFKNINNVTNTDKQNLSSREIEILELLNQNYTYEEIAKIVNLSSKTIRWHFSRIKKKYNLENKTDLIKFAVKTSNGK